MKACMHLCENLGGSRTPIDASAPQWKRARSFLYSIWIPIHDEQNEGEWRNFYDNKVLNFTRYVLYPPSKEKVHFYAPNSVKNLGIHWIRWQIQHWFVHRIQWPQIKCQKKHIFQWLFYHWIRWWFIGDYLLVTSWSNGCLSWSLSVACSFNVSKPSDLYWSHLSDFIFCFDLYH